MASWHWAIIAVWNGNITTKNSAMPLSLHLHGYTILELAPVQRTFSKWNLLSAEALLSRVRVFLGFHCPVWAGRLISAWLWRKLAVVLDKADLLLLALVWFLSIREDFNLCQIALHQHSILAARRKQLTPSSLAKTPFLRFLPTSKQQEFSRSNSYHQLTFST